MALGCKAIAVGNIAAVLSLFSRADVLVKTTTKRMMRAFIY